MGVEERAGFVYRVIAEGDDGICAGLSIGEALAVVRSAREHGKRHVAIVNDETGVIIDEFDARRLASSQAETQPPPSMIRSRTAPK
jgi:hypothetical protein